MENQLQNKEYGVYSLTSQPAEYSKTYSPDKENENAPELTIIRAPTESKLVKLASQHINSSNHEEGVIIYTKRKPQELLQKNLEGQYPLSYNFHSHPQASKTNHKNSESEAQVKYVNSSQLPFGNGWRALGQYNPHTHTIYIANDLSPTETEYVYAHEEGHSLGILDEMTADIYATRKTGISIHRDYNALPERRAA